MWSTAYISLCRPLHVSFVPAKYQVFAKSTKIITLWAFERRVQEDQMLLGRICFNWSHGDSPWVNYNQVWNWENQAQIWLYQVGNLELGRHLLDSGLYMFESSTWLLDQVCGYTNQVCGAYIRWICTEIRPKLTWIGRDLLEPRRLWLRYIALWAGLHLLKSG